MSLKEERSIVLQMLADGKITVEDSDQLLKALDQSQKKKKSNRSFIKFSNVGMSGPAFGFPFSSADDEGFLDELENLGYEDVSQSDYRQMKIHGVSPLFGKSVV